MTVLLHKIIAPQWVDPGLTLSVLLDGERTVKFTRQLYHGNKRHFITVLDKTDETLDSVWVCGCPPPLSLSLTPLSLFILTRPAKI